MRAELRGCLAEALATYRAFAAPILLAALLVFAPASLLEKEARRALGEGLGQLPVHAQLATLLSFAVGTAGYWFFAGLVSRAALARRAGEQPSLRELARDTPYLRLIVLDGIMAAAVSAGLALALLPGLFFAVRWGLAPSVLELRHCAVRRALGISVRLTRGRGALLVGALLLGIFALEEALAAILEVLGRSASQRHLAGVSLEAVLSLLAAALLVKPLGALATVSLALRLGASGPEHGPD